MGKYEKILIKILSGLSVRNIDFIEIVSLLKKLGFIVRIKGDYHIYVCNGIEEIINIQPNGNKAKPYQVKQIRNIFLKYKLII